MSESDSNVAFFFFFLLLLFLAVFTINNKKEKLIKLKKSQANPQLLPKTVQYDKLNPVI